MLRFATAPETRAIATGIEYRWPATDGRWAVVRVDSDYVRIPRRVRFALVRCLGEGEYIVKRCHCRRAAVKLARQLDAAQPKPRHSRRLAQKSNIF